MKTSDSACTLPPDKAAAREDADGGGKGRGYIVLDQTRCKGCSFCVAFCPKNVLEMGKAINEKGYTFPVAVRLEACTGCNNCGMFCPDFAIFGVKSANGKKGGGRDEGGEP